MPPTISLFRGPVSDSADLHRILALPRRPRVSPDTATAEALIRHAVATYGLGRERCSCATIQAECKIQAKPCIVTPTYAQAWALHEMAVVNGVVGQLAVGSGKTFLDIMLPLAKHDCRLAVVFVPSTLLGQLVTEYRLVAQHWRVPALKVDVPISHPDYFDVSAQPDQPVLRVMPYSRFQRHEATTYLERMRPDLVIVDEAQNLASASSARGARFLRYFATSTSRISLAAYSGTLTDDSLRDYWHFVVLALQNGAPLPLDPDALEEWCGAIDPQDWPGPEGALKALKSEESEHIQDAFHRRLVETPGIVMTAGASVDVPLEIRERRAPEIPDVQREDPRAPGHEGLGIPCGWWPGVKTCLQHLRATWERPDGEELLDALAVARCARELACGLFLRWKFVRGEREPEIFEWKAARKEWRMELRDKLKRREPYLDSMFLCALAARRYWRVGSQREVDEEGRAVSGQEIDECPAWDAETWPRWAAIKDRVRPVTEVVRLDPFLAQDAADWGQSHKGVIWYTTVGFGTWVSELGGLPMHGGGPGAGERIAAEDGTRSIVASVNSHGTGRDGLQRVFWDQLVTQALSSAVGFEQLFGRMSRIGQPSAIVTAEIYRHTIETRAAIDSALRKARYVGRTMGQTQRLTSSWQI